MEVEEAFLDSQVPARVVGAALAVAGLLALAAAVLPGLGDADRWSVAVAGVVLLALSGLARVMVERFGDRGLSVLAGWACVVVGAGLVVAGGGVSSAVFGFVLCWPVLAVAALASRRDALVLAGIAAAVYGGALAVRGVESGLWAWLALSVTLGAATLAMNALGSRVRHLARTDTRTGAVSPHFWETMAARDCARAARSGHPLCVAVVSVDGVDDYHRAGHMAGEQFLRETSHAWAKALRGGDLLTHLQADEFGILLPECGDAAARAVVDRLRHATPDGRTSSAGIAMWDGQEAATTLVNRACDALRHARLAGRDQSFISAA